MESGLRDKRRAGMGLLGAGTEDLVDGGRVLDVAFGVGRAHLPPEGQRRSLVTRFLVARCAGVKRRHCEMRVREGGRERARSIEEAKGSEWDVERIGGMRDDVDGFEYGNVALLVAHCRV